MESTRFEQQMQFIIEIDKLKNILRKTKLIDGTRYENDAEHTWHLMIMAVTLLEHANSKELNLLKVIRMLMIHDIVEIDAGDTFAYDNKGREDKREREEKAAARIFGLLPEDQRDACLELWNEFEDRTTDESKYAAALDRLQPLLFNYHNQGETWKKHGITSERVTAFNQHIGEGSEVLWEYAKDLIDQALDKGYITSSKDAATI
ncbi:HD domain-containing protein [Paenibacillus eucommiae]|uniref:Hydrolase of HD superfamily n=1 Tax=Paenibacillus eucommiae TaxID=1355755 RepID=A0ABS4ITX1_9BACL|nr:HD domain-containing protein [Paenibacillus eucommiae]MBP1991010.1 putative hydrolase of HD superfamily [Paenibacillus eucommiae]